MSFTTDSGQPSTAAPPTDSSFAPGDAIRRQVRSLLGNVTPLTTHTERRGAQRFAYPQLLYLTNVGADGITPGTNSVVVVGRTLSEGGVGFFHRELLVERTMIASFETVQHDWLAFLLDVRWCRFNALGWYESGGRFLQIVPSPIRREGL